MAQSLKNGASILPALTTMMPGMVCLTSQLNIQTETAPQFINITDQIVDFVAQSHIEIGAAVIFSRHTTAAIKLNENEPLLIEDMCERLGRMFPVEDDYRHNDFEVRTVNMTPDEVPNGHAHCQHLMLSSSETIPIIHGQLAMGRWQSLFLVELDRARLREILIFVYGQPRLQQ